jgi:outer membrane immunogenic protein
MKRRAVIAFIATSLTAGVSSAADWPVSAPPPQLYRPIPVAPVEWTGLYFGVNAGYGWAQGSSTTVFTGSSFGGTTTLLGLGATELSATKLLGSGDLNGGIAGGQIGFNWQSGMAVFGAEVDAQWSGQQTTFTVVCTTGCTATESVKIKSLTTVRARVGLAFDWLMPYVTAGGALVNASDDLTVTVGGVTSSFPTLSNATLGWTAGAGLEVALWSNWSARLEYLHVRVNDLAASTTIPSALGLGLASEAAGYRDNILRVGLNYRFGPRGGPGVLEAPVAPAAGYAASYEFLPSVATSADSAKSVKRPPAAAPIVTADAAHQEMPVIAPQPPVAVAAAQPGVSISAPEPAAPAADASSPARGAFKNFHEIGDVDETELRSEPKPLKLSSKKRRPKEEDESQRLKRIMAICEGC